MIKKLKYFKEIQLKNIKLRIIKKISISKKYD